MDQGGVEPPTSALSERHSVTTELLVPVVPGAGGVLAGRGMPRHPAVVQLLQRPAASATLATAMLLGVLQVAERLLLLLVASGHRHIVTRPRAGSNRRPQGSQPCTLSAELRGLMDPAGLEPATSALSKQHSPKLSYGSGWRRARLVSPFAPPASTVARRTARSPLSAHLRSRCTSDRRDHGARYRS